MPLKKMDPAEELRQARSEIISLQERLAAAEHQLAEQAGALHAAQRECDRLLHSRSWRVTAPLRRLKAVLQEFRGRPANESSHAGDMEKPKTTLAEALSLLAPAAASSLPCPPVTVVVPVYNGLAHLERLGATLFAHSAPTARFVFVDDASPDPTIHPFLQQLIAGKENCALVRNKTNLGFVRTVNAGMELVNTPYAVWLNTDVEVPNGWLERLLAPFVQDEQGSSIASTTPFTNSAVFFSFPVVGEDNAIPEGTGPDELDHAFARISGKITPRCDIHSGTGFCMGLNMACWNSIGPLDAKTFERGYGEECDWCMRASSRGWRNVLVPNMFAYHAHGGSFTSAEKQALASAHLEILRRRWPAQMADADEHGRRNPWEPYRNLAAVLLADSPERRCVLMVDIAGEGGGARAYREKQIARLTEQGCRVLVLHYTPAPCRWTLHTRYLGLPNVIPLQAPEEIRQLFTALHIDEVFVNNLAFCPDVERMLVILQEQKQRGCRLTYVFHDFLCVCPSFFLLDQHTRFCAGGSPSKCPQCLVENPGLTVPRTDIAAWRKVWSPFLEQCDELRFFSETTRRIAGDIYPVLSRGHVVEHEPLRPFTEEYHMPPKDAPLTIAFLGAYVLQKGSSYMKELAQLMLARSPDSRLLIFGKQYESPAGVEGLVSMGEYTREDLPALLTRYGVKAVVLPSPWPETFSYVTQECVMMGVPFVCFDIGAPAERIRKYNYPRCAIAPEISAKSLLETVDALLQRI